MPPVPACEPREETSVAELPALRSNTDLFSNLEFRDYLDILRRRKWGMIVAAFMVAIPAIIVAYRLPNVYRAATTIAVDAQKVPDAYVSPTVNSQVEDRLASIQQQVTSAGRLLKLIDRMHLYGDLRDRQPESEIIRRMQGDISVENFSGARRLSAFRISYSG
jgi:uncharacterized protein involved in exopolysaccharide biosynthesis